MPDRSPFDALEQEVDRIVVAVTADGNWREKGLTHKVRSATDAVVQGLPVVNT